ncbi:MAG: very short patch repair endonuclease [Cyclobacteriaceae bacterium]
MADVHSREVRSYNMSQIKGKNTKPEILVRKFLHANGLRFRLYVKDLPGKPDIVLPKYKTIIDIRGCFWHKHSNCKYGDHVSTPSLKITERRKSAVLRDNKNEEKWKGLGWNVISVWAECELEPRKKDSSIRNDTLERIIANLKSGNTCN